MSPEEFVGHVARLFEEERFEDAVAYVSTVGRGDRGVWSRLTAEQLATVNELMAHAHRIAEGREQERRRGTRRERAGVTAP